MLLRWHALNGPQAARKAHIVDQAVAAGALTRRQRLPDGERSRHRLRPVLRLYRLLLHALAIDEESHRLAVVRHGDVVPFLVADVHVRLDLADVRPWQIRA